MVIADCSSASDLRVGSKDGILLSFLSEVDESSSSSGIMEGFCNSSVTSASRFSGSAASGFDVSSGDVGRSCSGV